MCTRPTASPVYCPVHTFLVVARRVTATEGDLLVDGCSGRRQAAHVAAARVEVVGAACERALHADGRE